MTQALPGAESRSRLREQRRLQVLHARARLFRRRHHSAAMGAVLLVVLAVFRAFPGRDILVVSDDGAQLYHTVFLGEIATLPGLHHERALRAREFRHGAITGISVATPTALTVSADGRQLHLIATASTVAGALAEAGISLGPRDRVLLGGAIVNPSTPLRGIRLRASAGGAERLSDSTGLHLTVVRARPYAVWIDTTRVDVISPAATVGELVTDLGLVIREADLVEPGLDTALTAGMAVRLAPARTVNVVLDGQPQVLYTRAATVADVLGLLDLEGAEIIALSPTAEEAIVPGMTITVGTRRIVVEQVTETWPPQVVVEEDPSLPRGQVRIVGGQPGEVITTYEVVYEHGSVVQKRVATQGMTRPSIPVRQVIGTRDAGSDSAILTTPEYTGPYRKKVTVWATWYNASHGPWAPDHPAYGRTATGAIVDRGICAVDPDFIPLGTRFFVPGYGLCVAADVGGGIKGWKIDLGFSESAGPNPWRTGNVDIYLLD